MGDIPDDVKEAATEAAADGSWNGVPNEAWVQVIARAILAERQRCADVAMTCDFEVRTPPFASVVVADARKGIARHILNP